MAESIPSSLGGISSGSGASHGRGIFAEHILDDFIEKLGLDWLLYEVPRTLLQRSNDVLLVADGRHHDDARVGVLANDSFSGLDAFHLRHGDIHENDVRLGAIVFGDRGAAVARFSCDLAA